ncbi:MAG: hypothetical protein WA888_18365 [Burkholderiaceae bacterium]
MTQFNRGKQPDDVRAGLSKAMEQAIDYGNKYAAAETVSFHEKIVAAGKGSIVKPSPEELDQWHAVMKPVWKEFESEIGKGLIDAAQAANNQ